ANPLPIPAGPDGRAARGVALMRGHVGARLTDTTGDVDVYRVDVPAGAGAAVLVAEWSGDRKGDGIRGLDVALTLNRQRDEGGGRSAAPLVANVDRGGEGQGESLAAAVEPGTYFLAVRERHRDAAGPVEKPTDGYVLEVRLADPRPGEEVEPNDRPDSVSERYVRYAEWSSLAARNPLGEGTIVHAATSTDDPDLYGVAPRGEGERPELFLAVPSEGLALSAQTWAPDAEDLAPPRPADRVRFEPAGKAGAGKVLFVPLGAVTRASAPVLVQLRAEQGAGRYDVLALGPGSASGTAAIQVAEALAKDGRFPQALALLAGVAQHLPASDAVAELRAAAGRIEQEALKLIPTATPCTPDDVARRAVELLQAHPSSPAVAQEARLWQARALEEAYWLAPVRGLAQRAVAAYRSASELDGPGTAEARRRIRALEPLRPSREGAVRVCR
ncbi:MAG: hypothetical protein WCC48_08640, partial [Anaeromyxobacteraceae bacterium]